MMLGIQAQQLLLNMGKYALVPVHISHKLCLCDQLTGELECAEHTDDVSQSSGCSQQHLSSKCQQHMH